MDITIYTFDLFSGVVTDYNGNYLSRHISSKKTSLLIVLQDNKINDLP